MFFGVEASDPAHGTEGPDEGTIPLPKRMSAAKSARVLVQVRNGRALHRWARTPQIVTILM